MKLIWGNTTVLALLVAGIGANVDEKITCLVNVIRKQQKLPPLTMDERLTKAAEAQAKHQAKIKQMTHDGPNKSTVGNRADDAKYVWTTVAENVAYGFEDDETVMYKWWCSPGHKVNLLSPNKNHGSAKVFADNKVPYYAQVFGTEKTDPANAKPPSCDKYGKEIKKLEDLLKKPCDSPGTKPASTPPTPTAKTGRKKKKPADDYDTGSDELPAPAASRKKDEEEEGYPADESQVKKAKKSPQKKAEYDDVMETPPTPKEEDYPTDEAQVKKKDKKGTKKSPKKAPEEEGGYPIEDNTALKEEKGSKQKSRNAKKEGRKKANNDEYDMGDLPLPPAPLAEFTPTFPVPFPTQPAQPPASPRRTRSKKERRRCNKKQSKNHSNN